MSLAAILEKIKVVQPLAEEDVEKPPYETLTGRRGRKNQSIDELARLKRAYTNELRASAAFILVVGDKRDEFTAITEGGDNFFNADPEQYFADLVNRMPPTLYLGRESVSNLFGIVGRYIEEKAYELGISEQSQLIFTQEYQRAIKSKEDFQSLIKQAIVNQIGGEIVGIQATRTVTEEAIKRGTDAKFVSIVLSTGDEKFALKMLKDFDRISTRVFLVKAGTASLPDSSCDAVLSNVTKEEVKKAFNTIKKTLRK
jgi:hypothetical protein